MISSWLVLLASSSSSSAAFAPPPLALRHESREFPLRATDDDRIVDVFALQNDKAEADLRAEQAIIFQRRVGRLVGDHALISCLALAVAWRLFPLSVAASYALGALFGAAYLALLARYVASVGVQGIEGVRSNGVSQARFAVVGLLVLLAGKNREVLDFIPLLAGFFSYQLASFAQAFRPLDDDDADI